MTFRICVEAAALIIPALVFDGIAVTILSYICFQNEQEKLRNSFIGEIL